MTKFGEELRRFRLLSTEPKNVEKPLTQQKLGELLQTELGVGFSGAAVSDWERGASKIHADQRRVLIGIINVLHQRGGIKNVMDADQLLEAGNYRALNSAEIQQVFSEGVVQNEQPHYPNQLIGFIAKGVFFLTDDEVDVLYKQAEEGPQPSWPRVLAGFIRRVSAHFSISLTTIAWTGIWIIALWLIRFSLRWPLTHPASALKAIGMYVCGTLIVPLMIGLLVNTKDNEYWKQNPEANPLLLRMYTYQGAAIGFNLGYLFCLPFSLARYYLNLETTIWIEIMAATLGLILGNMAARVVPYNLWRAYGRLTFKDGGIFFIVALLGPLWGFFFLEYYSFLLTPILGILVILSALTIIVVTSTQQAKNRDKRDQPPR